MKRAATIKLTMAQVAEVERLADDAHRLHVCRSTITSQMVRINMAAPRTMQTPLGQWCMDLKVSAVQIDEEVDRRLKIALTELRKLGVALELP